MWKIFNDSIQNIPCTNPMDRRYWKWIAQAQSIEIIDFIAHFGIIHFINRQDNRLVGLIEHASDILVRIRDTFLARHDKNDNISLVHSNLSLVLDLLHKRRINIVNSACINNTKLTIQPICRRIDAVTSNPFHVFHNGNPLTRNPVK